MTEVLVVPTSKPVEAILRAGGTSSWRLARADARRCVYVVCTHIGDDHGEGLTPRRVGFLVGKVSDVVPMPNDPRDWLLTFSQFALADFPGMPNGRARIATLEDLGIDPDTLVWQAMPSPAEAA